MDERYRNKAEAETDKLRSGSENKRYPGDDFGGDKPAGNGPATNEELARDLEVSYPDPESMDYRG